MAANQNPIFPLTPNRGADNVVLTTTTPTYDGTGAGTTLVFTAGANGSYLQYIKATAIGTNIQSVLRVFYNNGSTNGTAGNNQFLDEYTLPASTAATNTTNIGVFIPMNRPMGATERIYVQLGTAVAAGWAINAKGGDY